MNNSVGAFAEEAFQAFRDAEADVEAQVAGGLVLGPEDIARCKQDALSCGASGQYGGVARPAPGPHEGRC